MVLPFQQIRSTAHGPMENPGWNELIELHRNDLVTLPAQEIHHGFPSEMCLNMMDLSLHCIDLTNQNGHLSAKAEMQWNISPTNFYLIWYASYIYNVYYECVWKWGIHGIPQKLKKKQGNVEISGRWEHDKTIGFWNSLIKTNQHPNKYPLVMTKLISLLLKPWPIEL